MTHKKQVHDQINFIPSTCILKRCYPHRTSIFLINFIFFYNNEKLGDWGYVTMPMCIIFVCLINMYVFRILISESREGIKGNTVLGLYGPPRQLIVLDIC